jgi:hypothetical protein
MQLNIQQPVGRGVSSTGRKAVNLPNDVSAVQELLNRILPEQGGPQVPLLVNGIVDQPTYLAIRCFQQQQFHWADGVVDQDNKTLHRLNELARVNHGFHWLIPVPDPDKATTLLWDSRALVAQGRSHFPVPVAAGYERRKIWDKAREQPIHGHFDKRYWEVVWPPETRKQGPPAPLTTHWCGIYATWVWSQANLDVEWRMYTRNDGRDNGPYIKGSTRRLRISRDLRYLFPGDILVQPKPFLHHMLVTSIYADGSYAEVLEGNAGPGGPSKTIVRNRTYVLTPVRDTSQVPPPNPKPGNLFFYSVDSYRWPDVDYN